jgi:acyl carrier protein
MTTPEAVLEELNQVFVRQFNKPNLKVTAATTADDVPGWDSLSHAELIVAVEKQFAVKFSLKEVMRFRNVGDMCAVIAGKVGK